MLVTFRHFMTIGNAIGAPGGGHDSYHLDVSGRDLCRRFYQQVVRPLVGDVPHAAALLGDGSEVLGFDDDISTDHDFGPRLQLFLPADSDPPPVHAALTRLPPQFAGFPVAYPDTDRHGGRPHHQVEVTTAAGFFTARLGVDPADGMTPADWLLAPTQILASLVDGPVFHDPLGLLTVHRTVLAWYPDDVWRYALAAGWLRVAQEEAFIGRTGARGDDLGSRLVTARVARELVRLAFLIERRWAPYSKWLGTAFARLPVAEHVGPPLQTALAAADWREREAVLCAASSHLAAATNRLGLAGHVDPTPRQFHTRTIQVLDAARFTRALTDAITDPPVRALLTRLGRRGDGTVQRLPGTIDQAIDSVDILTDPARCRASAQTLGLPL
jgi:Domain of unknown function (DUF4037)